MYYRNHKDIPADCKHFILEETQEGRIKNVPIHICNELIEEFLELQRENEKLKDFTVTYVNRNGNTAKFKFDNVQAAFVKMDAIIGHGLKKRKDIALVCRQAERVIKVYYKGRYMVPPAKDAVRVKKAS